MYTIIIVKHEHFSLDNVLVFGNIIELVDNYLNKSDTFDGYVLVYVHDLFLFKVG